uniref:RdRp n=1 Tax=Iris domestica betaflexivirus 1 TaxID=2794404 RepID=A0A7T5UG79_9VIRU|nr:RdRp [Iris domestica betaflexivirus 1]
MATVFVRRSPLQEVLSVLPSDQALALYTEDHNSSIQSVYNAAQDLYSYPVSKDQQEKLISLGINLAPYSFKCHPHPFSKMLENFVLYQHALLALKKFKRVHITSIKDEKFEKFKSSFLNINKDAILTYSNRLIHPKDGVRYKYHRDQIIFDPGPFKPSECAILMFDELHYWSIEDIKLFLSDAPADTVLASTVFPPEVLIGLDYSLNPSEYDFKVVGENLFCAPDGKFNDGYVQPKNFEHFLRLSQIEVDSRKAFGVDVLFSAYDHHLLIMQKGTLGSAVRSFGTFDQVDFSKMKSMSRNNFHLKRVRFSVYQKLHVYLCSLKSGSLSAATARVRQLQIDGNYSLDEISFAHDVFIKVARNPNLGVNHIGFLSFHLERWFMKLPDPLKWLWRSKRNWMFDINDLLNAENLRILIEPKVWGEVYLNLKDRPSQPYRIGHSDSFYLGRWGEGEREKINEFTFLFRRSYLVLHDLRRFKEIKRDRRLALESRKTRRYLTNELRMDVYFLELPGFRDPPEEGEEFGNCYPLERTITWNFPKGPDSTEDGKVPSDCTTNGGQDPNIPTCKQGGGPPLIEGGPEVALIEGGGLLADHDESGAQDTDQALESATDLNYLNDIITKPACAENDIGSSYDSLFGVQRDNAVDRGRGINLTNKCLAKAFSDVLNLDVFVVLDQCRKAGSRRLQDWYYSDDMANLSHVEDLANLFEVIICIESDSDFGGVYGSLSNPEREMVTIYHDEEHFRAPLQEEIDCEIKGHSWSLIDVGGSEASTVFQRMSREGRYGVISKGMGITKVPRERTVLCKVILGAAGCAKSSAVQSKIRAGHYPIKGLQVVSPRASLCQDWKNKVGRKGLVAQTHEVALKLKCSAKLVIFDEIGIFPSGYIETFLYKNPHVTHCIFLGDPTQSLFYSPGCMELNLVDNICDKIWREGKSYRAYTYRIPQGVSERLGITSFSKVKGEVIWEKSSYEEISALPSEAPVLVNSDSFRKILMQDKMDGTPGLQNVHTYTSCQGLTFEEDYYLVLDENAISKNNQGSLMCAATRGKKNLIILNITGLSERTISCRLTNGVVKALCGHGFKFDEELKKQWPWMKITHTAISGGKYVVCGEDYYDIMERRPRQLDRDIEQRTSGDPYLQNMISLAPPTDEVEIPIREPRSDEPKIPTHVGLSNKDIFRGLIDEHGKGKEEKEMRMWDLWSNQFCDEVESTFINLFPYHKKADPVTEWAGYKKRLKLAKPIENMRNYRAAKWKGELLFANFKEHVKLPRRFDQAMYDECIEEFEEKKISKPEKLIANHSERSDPDWPTDFVFLFQKVQHCTKLDNMFMDAKASQSIACFHHAILAHFSGLSRYVEKVMEGVLPKRFYIHQKKHLSELDDWVRGQRFEGVCTESDYSAFDASQDATILAFEVAFIRHLGFPEELIHQYEVYKTHLGCKLGDLAIMRFTGEFSTFMFNTMANMAFTFTRYHVNKFASIAFAGDDMICNQRLHQNAKYDEFFKGLTLKAKVLFHCNPTFCGWRLSKFGIVKDPKLMAARVLVMIERGLIEECIISYAMEVLFAYNLGDLLYDIFSIEDMQYHSIAVRAIIRHGGRSKFKAQIKRMFETPNRNPFVKIQRGQKTEDLFDRELRRQGFEFTDPDE